MTLKQYIDSTDISVNEFAKKVGVIPATLYRYIDGTRSPRPKIAHRIVLESGEKISFKSLYSSTE